MFNKKKEKTNSNPYSNLKSADAQYFLKLDEKIALAQKQNKKEFCEFLIDKKQFDMNYINVKNNNKIGKIDLLPSSLLSILNARDNEKAFENYKKDTMKIAKLLFDIDMTTQQICATACEFVRLSTANFDRYESESVQNPQSALCQLVSTNAYGMLSFYFGVSNAIDQTEFLAWLINLGLDIKHSLSYAECVIDSYGNPICHVVEFNGKLGVSFINYVGVAKAYTKKIETLTGLCQFIDFTDEIENGKKRALKALSRYVPSKLMTKGRDIEKSLVNLAQVSYKNMSDVTATELNMLSLFDNKIWKFSTLCELLLYENNIDYEVILDLFVETQYALKLKVGDEGKFKVFPNKVIDEEYKLNEPKTYILNKMAKTAPMSHDDELFNDRIESIGRESGQGADSVFDEFQQARNAQGGFSRPSVDELSLEDMEPMSATDVLNSLNVKFTPKENEGLSFENGSFKFNDDELNEVFDLSNATQVDLSKADAEQRMLENSMGIVTESSQSDTQPKRKGFFDLLNEMAEKTRKNKARRLQEEYERLERNHELKTPEEIAEQQTNIAENNTIPVENDYILAKNNNILAHNDEIRAKTFVAPTQKDNDYSQEYSSPTQDENIYRDEKAVARNYNMVKENNVAHSQTEFEPTQYIAPEKNDIAFAQEPSDDLPEQDYGAENYDAINSINENYIEFENANDDDISAEQDDDFVDDNQETLENGTGNSIYDNLMQFSDYNYYDRAKEYDETDDKDIDELVDEVESIAQSAVPSNENIIMQEAVVEQKEEPQQEPHELQQESNDELQEVQEELQEVQDEKSQPITKVENCAQSQEPNSIKETWVAEIAKPLETAKPMEPVTPTQSGKQVDETKGTSAPAVAPKTGTAPRAFAPPIPKRKPAPPIPKRKK